jgi:hypothetical protein
LEEIDFSLVFFVTSDKEDEAIDVADASEAVRIRLILKTFVFFVFVALHFDLLSRVNGLCIVEQFEHVNY